MQGSNYHLQVEPGTLDAKWELCIYCTFYHRNTLERLGRVTSNRLSCKITLKNTLVPAHSFATAPSLKKT